MSLGANSRKRTFLIIPDNTNIHIPSDLLGLNISRYSGERFAKGPQDRMAALQPVCMEIKNRIEERWGRLEVSRQKRLQRATVTAKFEAIKRLGAVASNLGDLLFTLQSDIFGALLSGVRFNAAKEGAAKKADEIWNTFRSDAELVGVEQELEDICSATKAAITELPAPMDFVPSIQLDATVDAAKSLLTSEDKLGRLRTAAASFWEAKKMDVWHSYTSWWNEQKDRMWKSTKAMNEALLRASAEQGQSFALDDE
jgi:hypothetical protein